MVKSKIFSLITFFFYFGIQVAFADSNDGGKILSYFQCSDGAETNAIKSEIQKMKNLAQALDEKNEQCLAYKDNFSNIPELASLVDILVNNGIINQIKVLESEIEAYEDQLNYLITLPPDDEQREWLPTEIILNSKIVDAKTQIIELKQEAREEEIIRQNQTASDRIYEVDRFFTNLTSAIGDNCFKENEGMAHSAMTSLASIAGLFLKSSWGIATTIGSKIINKLVDIGSNVFRKSKLNKVQNVTDPIDLMSGVSCAVKSFSQGQCRLLNKSKVYKYIDQNQCELGKLNSYKGLNDISEVQGVFDDVSQIMNLYREQVNEVSAGDAVSEQNNLSRINFEKEIVSLNTRMNGYRRRYIDRLQKGEEEKSLLLNSLGRSNFDAIVSFFSSIGTSELKRKDREFLDNTFKTLLFGDGNIDQALIDQFITEYLPATKKIYLKDYGSLDGYDVSDFENRDLYVMCSQLYRQYYDFELNELKEDTPASFLNIIKKMSSPDYQTIVSSSLVKVKNDFDEKHPIKSSKVGEIERFNLVQNFESNLGNSASLSPIDTMNEIDEIGVKILENRELLKSNLLTKKKELVSKVEDLNNSPSSEKNSFLKNKYQKEIRSIENGIKQIENYGYNDLVDTVVNMKEIRSKVLDKWTKYQDALSNQKYSVDDAKKLLTGKLKKSDQDNADQTRIDNAKNDFLRTYDQFLGYSDSSAMSENLVLLSKHLEINNKLWGQQLQSIVEAPEDLENALFMIRSNVYKDFIFNTSKFDEDHRDVNKALANSNALIKQNTVLFSPYINKVAERLKEIKGNVDPETWHLDYPRVKRNIKNNKSYLEAELREMKDFCLNMLAAAEITDEINKVCSGVKWSVPSGKVFSFDVEAKKYFENRVCIPKFIQNISSEQRNIQNR